MAIKNGIQYFLQGNAGGSPSPYMKVDGEGNVIVGQNREPTITQSDYRSYIFIPEEDPAGGTGIKSNVNSKYLGFLENGDMYVAVCLADEINGFEIVPNESSYNIIEGTEDDRLVLLSLSSTDTGSQAYQLVTREDKDKNNPPQKWIFTQVPPIKI